MKQTAIEYFEKNKGVMNEHTMVQYLRRQGIPEKIIEDAREIVFGRAVFGPTPAEHGSFWNFYDKKTYEGSSQKWADFFLGLFGLAIPLYIFVILDHFIGFIIAWALLIFQIFCIFYFRQRRKYISLGCIIATIFVPLVLFIAFLRFWG
jgi:hypothetical protein